MKRLFSISIMVLSVAVLFASCGGGGGGGGFIPSGPPANVAGHWISSDGKLIIDIQQSEAKLTGHLMYCSGNGTYTCLCNASCDSYTSFTGTVTNNSFSITAGNAAWTVNGSLNSNGSIAGAATVWKCGTPTTVTGTLYKNGSAVVCLRRMTRPAVSAGNLEGAALARSFVWGGDV